MLRTITSLEQLTECKVTIRDAKILLVEDDALAKAMLEILNISGLEYNDLDGAAAAAGAAGPAVKEKESEQTPFIEGKPLCKNCHQPFDPRSKNQLYCKKPECKKAKNREYWRLYQEKLNSTLAAEQPTETASTQEE